MISRRFARSPGAGGRGFTLVELLVVVVIMAILAALIIPAIARARMNAQWVNCSSNLHQFSLAWLTYLGQNRDRTPDWLSSLYPDHCSSKDLYVCAADRLHGRIDGSKPADLVATYSDPNEAFNETDDFSGNNGIDACSYFYEMCNVECGLDDALDVTNLPPELDKAWIPGTKETWVSYKRREMAGVVDMTTFPVIRCFHHWKDRRYSTVWDYPGGDGDVHNEGMTINVSYAGNVFFSPENWKARVVSGN